MAVFTSVMIVTHTLLLLVLQGSQPPLQALASTTGDSRLPQDVVCRDEAVLRRSAADVWPRVYAPQQTWMSHLGDLDGDALFDIPEGIDALSLQAPQAGTPASLFDVLFSTDRDSHGTTDGDVLRLAPAGGLEVVYTEAALLQDLQVPSANLDLDALCVVSPTELRISLRDGLAGTVLGDLADGDILQWAPSTGAVSLVATEGQVQAWVDAATGGSASIGDLKALSLHPQTGEMLFTVQSPTDADATVYTSDQGGQVLAGWEEDDWQFQVSTELDALCFQADLLPQPILLSTDVAYVQPATDLKLRLRHAQPGERIRGMAGPHYQVQADARGGVGYAVLDLSAVPLLLWPGGGNPVLQADASGTAQIQMPVPSLPSGMAHAELWYQAFASTSGWSSPVVLRVE